MERVYRGNRYPHSVDPLLDPEMDPSFLYYHESDLGPLPLILLSAFGVATAATTISVMTRSSFRLGLVTALGLCGFKLYFLLRFRSQPRYEMTEAGRRDKVVGYLCLAVILVAMNAFGLHEFWAVGGAATISSGQAIDSVGSFMGFLHATLSKDIRAVVCWIAASFIEVVVFFVSRNRRKYEYRTRAMYGRG